jgi:GNAT superfamily N-acetyltransferase
MTAGPLEHALHEDLVLASVAQGKRPWMRARGHSMGDAIPDGAFVQLQPPEMINRGDVVAAMTPSDQLVIHRVLDLDDHRVLLKGDALPRPDGWLDRSSVVAHVRRMRVGGQERPVASDAGPAATLKGLLTEADLLVTPPWALPDRYQLYVSTHAMRPWLPPGSKVWVARQPCRIGDVVVVRSPSQGVFVRRAVARRYDRVVVRADLSPVADGEVHQGAIVGVVEGRRLPLGRRGCRAVTDATWRALLLADRARGLVRRTRRRVHRAGDAPLDIRPLLAGEVADERAYRDAREQAYGPQPHTLALPTREEGQALGAFSGDTLVGAVTVLFTGPRAVRAPLFVVPEHRRLGVGRRLVAAALQWTMAQTDATLFWERVHVRNPASLKLFLANGFSVIDEPHASAVFDASRGEYPTFMVARWWGRSPPEKEASA